MNNCFECCSLSEILEVITDIIKRDKRLSITLLAKEIGVSRPLLSDMLHEKRSIKGEYLLHLIYRTGMKVSY